MNEEQNRIVAEATKDQFENARARERAYDAFLDALRPTLESEFKHWTGPRGADANAAARVVADRIDRIADQLRIDGQNLILAIWQNADTR